MIKLLKNYFNIGDPEWAVRRRLVVFIVMFCCGIIVWALGWITSDSRAENAINQSYNILWAIIATYIGGTVADKILTKQPAVVQADSTKIKQPDDAELPMPDPGSSIKPGAN